MRPSVRPSVRLLDVLPSCAPFSMNSFCGSQKKYISHIDNLYLVRDIFALFFFPRLHRCHQWHLYHSLTPEMIVLITSVTYATWFTTAAYRSFSPYVKALKKIVVQLQKHPHIRYKQQLWQTQQVSEGMRDRGTELREEVGYRDVTNKEKNMYTHRVHIVGGGGIFWGFFGVIFRAKTRWRLLVSGLGNLWYH